MERVTMRHREKGMKNFTQWYEAPYNQVLTLKVNNIEFEIKDNNKK